jgi:signal transduction histidine kinase
VKFTPVGGEVRVNATVEPDGRPLIAVTDTGIGMARDELPRAMEPFVRIEGVLTRQYEGTGLGLPLVKSLIELHGGRFELASAPGLGTTARAWLPADRLLSTLPGPDTFTLGGPITAKP